MLTVENCLHPQDTGRLNFSAFVSILGHCLSIDRPACRFAVIQFANTRTDFTLSVRAKRFGYSAFAALAF
ncbi:hypothetical protein QT971_25495 [Microcoleus sp. herbarium19]